MDRYSDLFDKKLIFWNVEANDRKSLYFQIAQKLNNYGIVKDSYYNALSKREDEFPTGLKTNFLPIALPHANPENVNQAFIAVVKTLNNIPMKQMGTNEVMSVKYFFFLGITSEEQDLQVKLLQRFMQLMNDQAFVNSFKMLEDPSEVYQFLVERF